MITLAEAKSYLRVETEMTAEDDLITGLINAASDYIQECTGKTDDGSPLYSLCEKILVAHWYENRTVVASATTELPHSVQAMLTHIKLSGKYVPQTGEESQSQGAAQTEETTQSEEPEDG